MYTHYMYILNMEIIYTRPCRTMIRCGMTKYDITCYNLTSYNII